MNQARFGLDDSPSCENKSMTQDNRTSRLGSLVTQSFRLNLARSRVDDSNLLIFACCHQLRAIPVEASAKDDIGMTVHVDEHFAGADIPDHDLIVRSGRQEHVERRRMP